MANIRCHVAVLSLRELFLFYTVVYSRILCALLYTSIDLFQSSSGWSRHTRLRDLLYGGYHVPCRTSTLSIYLSSDPLMTSESCHPCLALPPASICHSLFSVLSSLYLTHLFMYLDINDE